MTAENEASRLISMTDGLVTELLSTLENIPTELLNQDVGIPEVNTPFVLGRHVLGSIEQWGLFFGTGHRIDRDRDSEFLAVGNVEDLVAYKNSWMPLLKERVMEISNDELNNNGWRDEEPLSIGDALLHTVDHTAIHLGHLQLTKQIIESQDHS